MKNFLSIIDCSVDEIQGLLTLSADLKKLYKNGQRDLCLSGKTLGMLFEKVSLRTRISFHVAMTDWIYNNYKASWEHKEALNALTSIKEIEDYDIRNGWPDNRLS